MDLPRFSVIFGGYLGGFELYLKKYLNFICLTI